MARLVNLTADDLTRHIFRTVKWAHLLDLIENNRLVLVRPTQWQDPFESLMLRQAQLHDAPESSSRVLRWFGGDLFASCWTWNPETDFAWRAYSAHCGDAVIVKSTVGKLQLALQEWAGPHAYRDCAIGEVMYRPAVELLSIVSSRGFQQTNESDDTVHTRALGLLMKRPEFQHEQEVRVIAECADESRLRRAGGDVLLDIPIDANNLIESISLDPRLEPAVCRGAKAAILSAGYKGGASQSSLYRLPWDEPAQ
ncbi:MAG: hypothetical protein H6828_04280 [Planctomycetes bacterium]|nr:hypothetical protein [Planctomycetota bacterium]